MHHRMSEAGAVLRHGALLSLLIFFFFFLSCGTIVLCRRREDAGVKVGVKCTEREREALLAMGADIWDAKKRLRLSSSWGWEGSEDDCCRWEGVGCDGHSGRVVRLDLGRRLPYHPDDDGVLFSDYDWLRDRHLSKVNPSLLNLTSLKYLDLSYIDFDGAPIPGFVGSLANLEHLNLSGARFAGPIPPQLGSLRNLRALDLSDLLGLEEVENLHWLSHLSRLQYLDMSWVGLSEATDWLHVVNRLPLLSVLRLSHCGLLDLPTGATLPAVNFTTSLSTLDLSFNNFNSMWPFWLFNITSLKELYLDGNFHIHGPIPDGFGSKMKHLQVLSLRGNDFEGVIPGSLWTLDQLKVLSLSCYNLQIGLSEHFGKLQNLQKLELEGVVGRIPASLGNLSHLESLWLVAGNVIGGIPESMGNLTNLKDLQLSLYNVHGNVPGSLGHLSHLESLRLYVSNVTGGISESLGNLANLKDLDLSLYNIVDEKIPESLGNLSHLESLKLSARNVTGGIPESLGNLGNLKELKLLLYNVDGKTPESLGNLSHLESLTLYGGNISRGLLRAMGHLCNLARLLIYGSMGRGAKVNELVEGLSQCTVGSGLEILGLIGNGFVGHLPNQVGQLKNLKFLDLSGNSIVGPIPTSIGGLTSLTRLILSSNKLGGPVPIGIGELFNLLQLDISFNGFEGVLSEAHFANLSRLHFLDMSYNPALSLNVSWDWIPPFQLSSFRMRGCQMGPDFPRWLQTQQELYSLDLSSNVIFGTLPDDFLNSFPQMYSLNLSHNRIDGILPFSISSGPFTTLDLSFNLLSSSQLHLDSRTRLRTLDLSNNNISGPISVSDGDDYQLEYLDFSQNEISGSISLSICQMKRLQVLDLSHNHLSGAIPECWGNASSLTVMKISNNKLLGPIPISLGNLPQLQSLHMDKNNFTGGIPSSLKYSVQLVTLDLGDNQLSGELPAWLGESLSSLQVLRLRSNMFYGNIPMSLSQLQSLRILDLAHNRLSGTIRLSFHNLSAMVKIEKSFKSLLHPDIKSPPSSSSTFEESITIVPKGNELEYTRTLSLVTIIDLSNNNFSGQIPKEIACLKGMRFLNLSRNHLVGKIPSDISTMPILESLDLSFNQLSGNIPLGISAMYFLSHFNVSHNNLFGRIPSGTQLQTFDQSSYIGNPSLCGPPLLRRCPDDVTSKDPVIQPIARHEEEHEPYKIWLYIGMGTGFVAGFWGFLGMLLVMQNKRVMYFRMIDYVADELYVMIVIHFARLKLRISSCLHGKPMN